MAADIYLSSSGSNFQTASNLRLKEVLPETRVLGLSLGFGMNPFRQVFSKSCLLEVGAAILKSADSFLLLLLYYFTFWSPHASPFSRLFGLIFHGFLLNVKAYISGGNLSL